MRALFAVLLALVVAPPADAKVRLSLVGRFREPVYVTGAGSRLVVVERRGLIRDARTRRVVVDLRSRVVRPRGGEMVDQRGLFSAAWRNGRFYVEYVDRASHLRVDEIRGRRVRHLLDLGAVGRQHHGGQIAFGPDGFLYVSTGGSVLRFRPGEAASVYAMGLRNPWRFSFSRGALLIADVGESEVEKIFVVPAGGGAPAVALELPHPKYCAVIGGYVWRGRYVYGDLCSGKMRWARFDGTRLFDSRPLGSVFYLVSFGRWRGRLYAISFGGAVWRVMPR